jgi:exodeoxyribonuclease VII large subunit
MTSSTVDTAISVAELTTYLRDLIESDRLLEKVLVAGEVSSVNQHSKGLFFTLSDPDEDVAIQCVVWNNMRVRLAQQPQRGELLLVLGSLRLYPKKGEYRLTVYQAIAIGEGLFDPDKKRPLPSHPQTIAVITSPTAAAWGDIKRTLEQRYPGLHILFSPATVQGIEAPNSIVEAIEKVNHDGRAETIILARGGGAVEDLSCFNDERVVRAIAASKIPIITGIGHQRDESLADLVADFSAHTPTAAAETAVPLYEQLAIEHQQRIETLIDAFRRRVELESEHLQELETRLKRFPLTSPQLLKATSRCQLLRQKLIALDPRSVLQRGYAVVRAKDDNIVRATDDLTAEQELKIQLSRGVVKVIITEILE